MKRFSRLRNAGFTLVEIVVALAILSIATAAIGTFLVTSQRSYTNAATETDLQYEAQLLSNEMQDLIIDVNRGITYTYSAKLADDSEELGGKIHTDLDIGYSADDLKSYISHTKSLYIYNKGGYVVLTWDQATGEIKYSTYEPKKEVVPVSENNLLAEYVTGFSVDLSEISEEGNYTVSYTITFEAAGKTYTTTHKVKLRNEVPLDVTADIYDDPSLEEVKVGDIVVAPSEIILWPGQSYGSVDGKTISATVSSTGGLLMFKNANWKIYYEKPAGSTEVDSEVTPSGSKVEKKDGKVVVTVAEEEVLNRFWVYAEVTDGSDTVSSLYNKEGVATTFNKCLCVQVRRINSMTGDVTFDGSTYTDDTVELQDGSTGVATHVTSFAVTPNPSTGDDHIDTEIESTYSDTERASVITAVGGLASITVMEYYCDSTGAQRNQEVTTGTSGNLVQNLVVNTATGIVSFDLKEMNYTDESYYAKTQVVIQYLTNRMNTKVPASALKKTITVKKKAQEIINPSDGWNRDGLLALNMDTLNGIMSAEKAKGHNNPVMNFEFYSGHATAWDSDGNVTAMTRTPEGYPRVYNNTIGNNGGFDTSSAGKITIGDRTYLRYNNNGGDVYLLAQQTNNAVMYDNKYYDVQLYLAGSDVFPYSGLFVDKYGNVNNNDCMEIHVKITGDTGVLYEREYFVEINPVKIQYSVDGINWVEDLNVALTRGTTDSTKRVYFRFTEGWGGVLNSPAFYNKKTSWYSANGDDDFNSTELGYDEDSRDYEDWIDIGSGYAGGSYRNPLYTYDDTESDAVDGLINRFNVSAVNLNSGISSSYYYSSDGYTNDVFYKRSNGKWRTDDDSQITLSDGYREHSSNNDYFKITQYNKTAYFSEYSFSKNYGRAANYFSVTQGVSSSDSQIGYLDFVVDQTFAEQNKGQTFTLVYEQNPYMAYPYSDSTEDKWSVMAGCSGTLSFTIADDNVLPANLLTNLTSNNSVPGTPSVLSAPVPGSSEWKKDSSDVRYYLISNTEKYELIYKDNKWCLTYLKYVNNAWVNQWTYKKVDNTAHTSTTYTGYLVCAGDKYGLNYTYEAGNPVPYHTDNVIYANVKTYLKDKNEPSSLYAPLPGASEWISSYNGGWYYNISDKERYRLFKSGGYYYLTYQKLDSDTWYYEWYDVRYDTLYLKYSSSNKSYNTASY